MVIEALEQISSDRVKVRIAGGEEILSSLGVVAALRLYSGKELDENRIHELRRESRNALGRDRALELISHRPMSARELKKKLLDKGEDEETAEFSVRWLEERGYLNDGEYAAVVVRHYAAKHYGPGRIRAELSRRGVPRELWEEALEALPQADEGLDRYVAAKLKDPDDPVQVRKLATSLSRRGYSWEEIRGALRRYSDNLDD